MASKTAHYFTCCLCQFHYLFQSQNHPQPLSPSELLALLRGTPATLSSSLPIPCPSSLRLVNSTLFLSEAEGHFLGRPLCPTSKSEVCPAYKLTLVVAFVIQYNCPFTYISVPLECKFPKEVLITENLEVRHKDDFLSNASQDITLQACGVWLSRESRLVWLTACYRSGPRC